MRCFAAGLSGAEAGEFQGAIGGFRTAIGEKDAVHAGDLGELAGQRALIGVVVEVGEMNGASGFAANDFDDAGMRVAESVDGDAAEKIQVSFAGGIKNVAAAAVAEDEGLALVGGQEKFFRVAEARIDESLLVARWFGPVHGARDGSLFVWFAHHAAEKAACAAGRGSRKTRVPGISPAPSGE
jgi:hypothetical protein